MASVTRTRAEVRASPAHACPPPATPLPDRPRQFAHPGAASSRLQHESRLLEERKRAERVRARTRALPRPPASARLLLLDSSTRTRPSFAHPRFFSPQGKNLVVLMLQHLTNAGYTGSVEALTAESGVSLA